MIILSNVRYPLLALALLTATATPSAAGLDDHPELQPQDVHEHDRCLVCGGELEKDEGLAFLYKGRRITLDTLHLEEFLQNPATYFSHLQPRGALFQESGGIHLGKEGLFLGVWMVLGLAGALDVAARTTHQPHTVSTAVPTSNQPPTPRSSVPG